MATSTLSEWLEQGDEITLPNSRKVVRVRQVDLLSMLSGENALPNLLINNLFGDKKTTQVEMTASDMLKLAPLLDRMCRLMLIEPRIVNTIEEVEAGKGILLSFIPLDDKTTLMNYAIGGAQAFNDAARFPLKQGTSMDSVQPQQTDVSTAVGAAESGE